ncbi:MAG TPA: alanine racemase [Pseudolabrys sp.]|nr:alanine racemase [Pseudolabrys sp.]
MVSGPPEAEAGGILTIDLDAIVANWRALGRRAMPAECAAVVKADAYGCGLAQIGTALAQAGCRTFFVADLDEARRLRAIVNDATIYVLGGLPPGTGPAFADLNVRPCIGSLIELAEWDAFVAQSGWRGSFALHVDTGMNRLGITPDEAAAAAARIRSERHGIALLMSHLACADTPEHPLNDKQIRLFRDIRLLYRGIPASLANSSGIFLGAPAHCDLVRPGAALYGVNPTPGQDNPMQPVVTLRTRILLVRSVERGETVGYGAGWTAKKTCRIAVVPIGYADGVLRSSGADDRTPGGQAIVGGQRCRFAGRISMDLIAIDVTDIPETQARRGDVVTLIGDGIGVDDVAAAGKTIGYEVLTQLSHRYHRIYRRTDRAT